MMLAAGVGWDRLPPRRPPDRDQDRRDHAEPEPSTIAAGAVHSSPRRARRGRAGAGGGVGSGGVGGHARRVIQSQG